MKRILLALLLAATPALAFPDRPVALIIPFAAGGPTDVLGRTLAEAMSRGLGVAVTAENVTGAGGTIGGARVANARPDGHTLLLGNIGVATVTAQFRNPPYDPLVAFAPIGLISPVPMVVIGRTSLPVRDFPGLIAWLRETGLGVNLAHAGVGSASHLCMTLLRSLIHTEMTAIAFRGTAPVMTEIMAGRVDISCDQTTSAMPFVTDGRVRAFAVTSPARLPQIPEVPTAGQAGLPGLEVSIWHGLYAPRGTPDAITQRLAQALRVALAEPRVVARLADLATTPEPPERVTPEALRAHLADEVARWTPVLRAAGEFAD